MAEASWLRLKAIIASTLFFTAIIVLALTAFALNTSDQNTQGAAALPTPPQPTAPRAALLYFNQQDLQEAALPGTEKLPLTQVLLSPSLLRGYDILVVTNKAAQRLAQHPQLVMNILRSGTTILVQGPRPIASLLANIKPGPGAPLLLIPLADSSRPGLPKEAAAAAIAAGTVYPDGRIAPHYTVFRNMTLGDALQRLLKQRPMTAPRMNSIAITTILYDLDRRWYYVGELAEDAYLKVGNIVVGITERNVIFHWTPDYNDIQVPANCLWRVIVRDKECTDISCIPSSSRPYVVDSIIPRYRPLLGWTMIPNMMAVNVSYYIDQDIVYAWPDMSLVGPASETVSGAITYKGGAISYTVTIPNDIVVKIGIDSAYSSYFGRVRDLADYWLWGFQSLLGEARSGSAGAIAYVSAPCTAVDTRWPLAPPGLFVGVRFRDAAKASIVDPANGLVIPGLEVVEDTMYRFYVSTVDATLLSRYGGLSDSMR